MKPVEVRGVRIGEGIPKICVPIVGETRKNIIEEARRIAGMAADIVEWRADWYEDVYDLGKVTETLSALREALGDLPLLFTFRTAREGGEREISSEYYQTLNIKAAESGNTDLVDVELFTGDAAVKEIIRAAHGCGVKVVVSNHDFDKTPEKDEIISLLCKMQELGADIPKIAVMPQSKRDVLTLLAATEEMAAAHADRPIITMSMGGMGVISRLCGEVFGSALTFGSAGKASAPGQIAVEDLEIMLKVLNKNV